MSTTSSKTHLFGDNLPFIEQLYTQYLEDPKSVDPSWEPVFAEYFDTENVQEAAPAPSFVPKSIFSGSFTLPPVDTLQGGLAEDHYTDPLEGSRVRTEGRSSGFAAKVEALLRAYRLHGHKGARINPLMHEAPELPVELDPIQHGIKPEDLGAQVQCEALFEGKTVTLGEVVDRLQQLYCGTIAIEYQHISDTASRRWLRKQIESRKYAEVDAPKMKRAIYQGLVDADGFETFLHRKYIGAKRFSLSGGDTLIPMMRVMLDEGGRLGATEALFGMAHRGRLNVLHNIMGKPAANMFSEFEKSKNPEKYLGSSDVKYHMGYSSDYTTPAGKSLHLSLAFNPSHLEFVDPVVVGRARAKQTRLGTEDAKQRVVPILLHGDAAFSGQGVVAETFNLSLLPAYHVGGTIHIVTNNQIGFTTLPEEGRSTRYATDIAKMVEVPILHVNGDDPEACVRVALLAIRYRQKFGRDVVIDHLCYRQYGHNEGDEPRYTQPLMYKEIDAMPPVRKMYADHLVETGVLTTEEVEAIWQDKFEEYSPIYDQVQERPKPKSVSSLQGLWEKYRGGKVRTSEQPTTQISVQDFHELGTILTTIPSDFGAHRSLKRIFAARAEMGQGERPVDWGFGEALAFASLLKEGINVRLTGQDSIRGTFSHRHAALFDMETGLKYWPASHISEDQGKFEVYNSSLSETAVLGFEYGFALDSPDSLVMWEAQFGDFVNGAQVIIDQFINSGEDKWRRMSGLVMLLPHGYEGQGPEHSSARLERFLQLCAEDNMFVCNFTTPAQYFHALRRQMLYPARKPLIVMTPKSLLRLKEATNAMEDFTERGFQHVIDDEDVSKRPLKARRVVLCSGKVFYDLKKYAQDNEREDVAVVRVEQLYPLDRDRLKEVVGQYGGAPVCWVQEEPKNMGAWSYIFPELIELFGASPLPVYIGREASASPATGDPQAHQIEQQRLIERAFSL